MTDRSPSSDSAAAPPDGNLGDVRTKLPFHVRRERWFGATLVLLVCGLLIPARLWLPTRLVSQAGVSMANVQITEAQQWWQGRLDLPRRIHDTALKDGRVYSYFPPMFTFVAAVVVPFFDGFPHLLIVAIAALVPLLAYWLFLRLIGSTGWAVVLTLGFVCGTSAWPVLTHTIRGSSPYHVNHTLAMIGLLIMLIEYHGKKRVWPAGIGLVIAAFSRQLTVMFAIPLLYMALFEGPRQRRGKRFAAVAAIGAGLLFVYCGLNVLKFGHPLTTGYQLNHEARDDIFAREAHEYGTLSLHWIPRNLYYANIGPPKVQRITMDGKEEVYLRPNTMGTGIWWTSPLLLWLLIAGRRMLRERPSAALLAAAASVYGLLMLWHATGAIQRGYNRYSLDYLPAVFAVIVLHCMTGKARYLTLAMIAWGIAYYWLLLPMPRWHIWTF